MLLCCMLLTACATPQQQAHVAPSEPPVIREGMFYPGDGAALPVKVWQANGKPRAVVIALHGFNDYRRAFLHPAVAFADAGILTVAYDQRGFGGTARPGIWAGRENLISDLAQMVRLMRATYPAAPLFLLGESMGGAVAVSALAEPDFPQPDGAFLVAPALWGGETMSPLYRVALSLVVHTFPGKELTGEGLKIQATDNIPLLREMGRDPLVFKKARVDAVYGMVNLMDEGYRRVPDLRVPVLLLYGTRDQVIPADPIHSAAERMPPGNDFREYADGWHMLLRDLDRAEVQRDIIRWMMPGRVAGR